MSRCFLDTNVLVYADDLDAGDRRTRAREVLQEAIRSGLAVLSTQVLQEYYVVATRKLGVEPESARRKVELFSTQDVVRIEPTDVLAAIDLVRLHSFSLWDALVVRCALKSGCSRLLTEDMQDGWRIEGLRVENPFR